ncbi:MAG: cyclase family protein [Candidatus Hodarchaeota archaeon]
MVKKIPYRIIDLTHTLNDKTPSWDKGCGFSHEIKLDYSDCNSNVKFRVQQIKMLAGIGTHIDAPAHCIPNGTTVEALSINDLIAPAYCINVSAKIDPEYKLSADEILSFEKQHGTIEKDSFIIIYTGWSKYWHTPTKYHNNYKFPSISLEAAQVLLKRKVVGIGIDTLSPDVPSSGFPVHRLILGSGKYIIENVANGDQMPPNGSYSLAMPIKAAGLTESPIRLIGLINEQKGFANSHAKAQ